MELEDCCRGLKSTKVTERSRSVKKISVLLQKGHILEQIRNGVTLSWDQIISSAYICITKDAQKYREDMIKRNSSVCKYASSGNMFFEVVGIAIKKSSELDCCMLVMYFKNILSNVMMKELYSKLCFVTLKNQILCHRRFIGDLTSKTWTKFYLLLTHSCAYQVFSTEYGHFPLECLELVIKWGTKYSLSPITLSKDTMFFANICENVSTSLSTYHKEIIIRLIYTYCLTIAKDNRIACCHLGEEVFVHLIDLYEVNLHKDNVKNLLVDLFQLLVVLHHPNGAKEGDTSAYAYNWQNWRKYLKAMYLKLYKDFDVNFKCTRPAVSGLVTENEHQNVCKNFIDLFVDIAHQVLNQVDTDVSMSTPTCSKLSPSQPKRQKCEYTLKNLIDNVNDTKSWQWVQIVYSLVKIYPDVIVASEFIVLLRMMWNLQKEYGNRDLHHHVYECLLVLEDIETSISLCDFDKTEADNIWKGVSETTLKEVSSNLYCDNALDNILLKLLEKRYNNFCSDNILDIFKSGIIFNEKHIKLLYAYGQIFKFPQFERNNIKLSILDGIFNQQNLKNAALFSDKLTAKVLVCLLLKEWPRERTVVPESQVEERMFQDIERVYVKSSISEVIGKNDCLKSSIRQSTNYNSQQKTFDYSMKEPFVKWFANFTENLKNSSDAETAINSAILLKNILCELFKHKMLDIFDKGGFVIENILSSLLANFASHFNDLVKVLTETNTRTANQQLETFYKFLKENDNTFIVEKIVSLIPTNFLTELFNINNLKYVKKQQDNDDIKLKLIFNSTKVLSMYYFTSVGEQVIEAFTNFQYSEEYEVILAKTFLTSFNNSAPGCLSENKLLKLLELITKVCVARYFMYEDVIEILKSLKTALLHLQVIESQQCFDFTLQLISVFYIKRASYGPQIAIMIIKCLETVCRLNSNYRYTDELDNKKMILLLCGFLCSELQEVRLALIESIGKIFSLEITSRKFYNTLREVFIQIFQLSLHVFKAESSIIEGGHANVVDIRSACILQTFASLAMSNAFWIHESLFSMLRIVHLKKVIGIEQILDLLAGEFKAENTVEILENHLAYIIERWLVLQYSVEDFPFNLWNCGDQTDFYVRYYKIIAPILIQQDRNTFSLFVRATGKDEINILEEYCPLVFSDILSCEDLVNLEILLERNDTLFYIVENLTLPIFKDIITDRIEEVISSLLGNLIDEVAFKSSFDEPVIFHTSQSKTLTVEQFYAILEFIRAEIINVPKLFAYLTENRAVKIYRLVLEIKQKLDKSKTEKLQMFHSYSVLINLMFEEIKVTCAFSSFLVRDTIHYLLNLMEDFERNPQLSKITSRYFYSVTTKIVIGFPCIKQFFHFVVNKLNNLALQCEDLTKTCVSTLNMLVSENYDKFKTSIETLDPFEIFKQLGGVNMDIKYNYQCVSLKKVIDNFLECGYETGFLDTREEGLKYLKRQLSEKKEDMNLLFSTYQETSFRDDCEKNIVHKLVRMLLKLCQSSKSNISLEACRCLGEIGPANLHTLILQPEKSVVPGDERPTEILAIKIISCLLTYIIDQNIKLVTAAFEGLFYILSNKDGRKVATSGEDFGFSNVYLTPFVSDLQLELDDEVTIDEKYFVTSLNDEELWSPKHYVTHENWIVNLTCSILKIFSDKCFLPKLIPVCNEKSEFCEEILPNLLHFIIEANEQYAQFIYDKMGHFLEEHWRLSIAQDQDIDLICMNKTSLKIFLDCASYIRFNGKTFRLNYLHLAHAAKFCSQHFSAILYTELWCHSEYTEITENNLQEPVTSQSILETVFEIAPKKTVLIVETILRDSHKVLGELDAVAAYQTSLLSDPLARVDYYKVSNRWDQVTLHYDCEISNRNVANTNLVKSLRHNGLYKLPLLFKDGADGDFECLWRLGQWDINEPKESNIDPTSINSFERHRYFALKYLHENDYYKLEAVIKQARVEEVEKIKHASSESCRELCDILTRLQALREIECVMMPQKTVEDIEQIISKWNNQDSIALNEFKYIEPIKTQRIVILGEFVKTGQYYNGGLINLVLDLVELARKENYLHIGIRNLYNIYFLKSIPSDMMHIIRLADAKLCWALKNRASANKIIKDLCNEDEIDARVKATALKLRGKWLIESSLENRDTIINYLTTSLSIYSNLLTKKPNMSRDDEESIVETYEELGRYFDQQYQNVSDYMISKIFQQKIKNVDCHKQAVSEIMASGRKLTLDEESAVSTHEKSSKIDEVEIQNAEEEKNSCLNNAINYYLLHLVLSDKNNIRIFRVISLFLENRNNVEISDTIKKYSLQVPTYKYIPVLPQMVPHLSDTSEDLFVTYVKEIIVDCIKEHPHHTLPLVLNLANAHKDKDYRNYNTATSTNNARISSALALLDKLKTEIKLSELVKNMEYLSEALIQLAYYKGIDFDSSTGEYSIPDDFKIRKITNFSEVLLQTYNLPVNKNCSYDGIVGIYCFGNTYKIIGGVNAPKLITCRGTDGKNYLQLVKGYDDLRQDAVMQQVFRIMNNLLSTNKITHHLSIRTYKVIPLSMRSGVLEWVENTTRLGLYLSGPKNKTGAHQRYRPQDKTPQECKRMFMEADGKPADEKLKTYKNICKVIKPVFHKFFEHNFPQPSVWYERRRAYIHSVATTSMCGYLLGIGDRHTNNILIDEATAEVVHVDFGIAFEKGRVLDSPETVPFRLTRDIVDGMGVCGTEGIFRKSCEKTLEVMRNNSKTIFSILEVLLYDPLYAWTITSAEATKRHRGGNGSDDSNNMTAERALMRLKSKLHGIENGYPMSIDHQVVSLIQEAQDPVNLCKLFYGWQPYL